MFPVFSIHINLNFYTPLLLVHICKYSGPHNTDIILCRISPPPHLPKKSCHSSRLHPYQRPWILNKFLKLSHLAASSTLAEISLMYCLFLHPSSLFYYVSGTPRCFFCSAFGLSLYSFLIYTPPVLHYS